MSEKKICKVDSCDRVALAHGLCRPHYTRFNKHGDVMADIPIASRSHQSGHCKAEDCHRNAKTRGMCSTHYRKFQILGEDALKMRIRETLGKQSDICQANECDRETYSKNLCTKHYQQHRAKILRG